MSSSITVDENLSLMDLFQDNELMEDLSSSNSELIAYLKLPKYYNAALEWIHSDLLMCSSLLNLTPGSSEFENYKVPYLASVCMWILPESSMKSLFSDSAQFDRVFSCIFSDDISTLFVLA